MFINVIKVLKRDSKITDNGREISPNAESATQQYSSKLVVCILYQ